MFLTPLQIFFVVSGTIILVIALDVARRERFNALHFLVFIAIGLGLLLFTFFPSILDAIGHLVGIQRGADALVYAAIIFLLYFVLLLLRKIDERETVFTELVRNMAIEFSTKKHFTSDIVFVVPLFNEDKVLKSTLGDIHQAYPHSTIIAVNDGSSDKSHHVLDEIKEKWKDHLIVLHHLKNNGQWAALETGFEYIRRYGNVSYIVTFDSDWQHDIRELSDFLHCFHKDKHLDIALGSRFLSRSAVRIPLVRRVVLKVGILFTWCISGILLSDTHNGYRVMRRRVLDVLHITLSDMTHASEILDIVARKKLRYCEVPVTISYNDRTIEKWQSSANALKIAKKLITRKFFL